MNIYLLLSLMTLSILLIWGGLLLFIYRFYGRELKRPADVWSSL